MSGVGQHLKTYLDSGKQYAFEKVTRVAYLGTCLTDSGGIKDEIHQMILMKGTRALDNEDKIL